jgi:hypothetical protein
MHDEFLPVRTACTVCLVGGCNKNHQGHEDTLHDHEDTLRDHDKERECLKERDLCADPVAGGLLDLFGSSADVLAEHILTRLEPTEIIILNHASLMCGREMLAFGDHKCRARDCVESVERLKWALESGCPMDWKICSHAARGGHLKVLMWAREHGCEWNRSTCAAAAHGGHLEVLMWAREHGCPWDRRTCAAAAHGGHLQVLTWARDHGCPWDKYTLCVVS